MPQHGPPGNPHGLFQAFPDPTIRLVDTWGPGGYAAGTGPQPIQALGGGGGSNWSQLLMGALQSPQIQALLGRQQQQPQFSFPAAPGLQWGRGGVPFQLPQLTAFGGMFGGGYA